MSPKRISNILSKNRLGDELASIQPAFLARANGHVTTSTRKSFSLEIVTTPGGSARSARPRIPKVPTSSSKSKSMHDPVSKSMHACKCHRRRVLRVSYYVQLCYSPKSCCRQHGKLSLCCPPSCQCTRSAPRQPLRTHTQIVQAAQHHHSRMRGGQQITVSAMKRHVEPCSTCEEQG